MILHEYQEVPLYICICWELAVEIADSAHFRHIPINFSYRSSYILMLSLDNKQ